MILELTADGSHTIFLPELNEHYHSVNGAIQEALHVYINAGLVYRQLKEIHLFEVGFGTGLNAFLTLLSARQQDIKVVYHTIERFPVSLELISKLNYASHLATEEQALFEKIHSVAWNEEIEITPDFSIKKIEGDLNAYLFDDLYDVIYFDAFAPDKQDELWNATLFARLFEHTAPQGVLTTYCAKGIIRRMFQSAGYVMERIPGPPGKREMLRGTKQIAP